MATVITMIAATMTTKRAMTTTMKIAMRLGYDDEEGDDNSD